LLFAARLRCRDGSLNLTQIVTGVLIQVGVTNQTTTVNVLFIPNIDVAELGAFFEFQIAMENLLLEETYNNPLQ